MAITNVILPEKVSLARGPVEVKVSSNLPTEAVPINYLRIRVDDTLGLDQIIRIVYGQVDETFTVKVLSDNSGSTLSQRGNLSIEEYAHLLVADLKKNYALFTSFEIEVNLSGSIYYVNISPRLDKSLDWSFDNNLTGVEVQNIRSTNNVFQLNQAVLLIVELFNHESQSYDRRLTHVLPIIEFGQSVDFDISDDFNLSAALPNKNTIGMGGQDMQLALNNWTKYRLYYTEQVGRPVQTSGLSSNGEEYFALYAGNDYFNQYAQFWSYWEKNGKFLTAAPRTQTISIEEPKWLYWIGRVNRIIKIGVKVYYRQGTPISFERGDFEEIPGQVLIIKAGFKQLQLPDNATNPIVKYEVYLTSGKSIVSEIFTFNLTGSCDQFTRYFLFANSLGGCDTLRTTAKHESSLDTVSQVGSRITNQENIDEAKGQNFNYNRRSVISYEGSTGFKSSSYISYLQDFINSPQVWLVDVAKQRFTPVILSSGQTAFIKDDEDLYALNFSYQFAYEEAFLGTTDDGNRINILVAESEEAQSNPCIDC